MRSHRPLITFAALALLAAACGGDDDAAGDSIAPVPSTDATAITDRGPTPTTTTPTTTPTTTMLAVGGSGNGRSDTTTMPTTTPATVTPATVTPASTTPITGAGDCLVGDWVITEGELNAFYDALEAGIDGPMSFTVAGTTRLDFTATEYRYMPEFDLTLELQGMGGSGVTTGSVSGTYTTADGLINAELGSSDLAMQITVGGSTIDGSTMGNGLLDSVPFVDSPYSCDGPTPVIMFATGDPAARHPVTLTPA